MPNRPLTIKNDLNTLARFPQAEDPWKLLETLNRMRDTPHWGRNCLEHPLTMVQSRQPIENSSSEDPMSENCVED